jgi:hypothetical protein
MFCKFINESLTGRLCKFRNGSLTVQECSASSEMEA